MGKIAPKNTHSAPSNTPDSIFHPSGKLMYCQITLKVCDALSAIYRAKMALFV